MLVFITSFALMSAETHALKRTSLYNKHLSLGAKMVPFAGYEMPLQYSGLSLEHHAVRDSVGMFDVSHISSSKMKNFRNFLIS